MRRLHTILRVARWALALLLALLATSARAEPAALEDRDPAFVAGRAALEDGLNDLARRKFEEYIRKAFFKDKRALGSLYLVQALHAQGQFAEGLAWLDQHAEWTDGSAVEGDIVFWRARLQTDAGQPAAALQTLETYSARFPENRHVPAALRLRAHAEARAGRTAEALASFAEFARRFPAALEAPENLLDWARILLEQRKRPEARDLLNRLVQDYALSPSADEGRLWLADLLLDEPETAPRGRTLLEEVAARSSAAPDLQADALLHLARLDQASSNYTAAARQVAAAAARAQSPALVLAVRLQQARLAREEGRLPEATALAEKTLKEFAGQPGAGEALLLLADLRYEAREFAPALDAYQKVVEGASQSGLVARALAGKGWCLWSLQRVPESAVAFDKAAAALTNAAARQVVLLQAAEAHRLSGDPAAAQERYIQVRDAAPADPRVPGWLLLIAECDIARGRHREAEGGLRFIVDQYPELPEAERALLRLAADHESQARWDDAAKVYDDLMLMYPKSTHWVGALLGRGYARFRGGQFGAARRDFEQVLEKFPAADEAEQAAFLRGWSWALEGDTKRAIQVCREFLVRYPRSRWVPEVQFWLGEQAYNQGDFAAAEAQFAKLLQEHPQSDLADDALYWAGRAAAGQNDYPRAITRYNDLAKAFTNSPRLCEARFAQGDALSELGEFAGAILAFDEVLKRCPGTAVADRALGRKGDCLFTLGSERPERYQEAVTVYRSLLDQVTAAPVLRSQAGFKLGRCYEKMGRGPEALEQFMTVVYDWLAQREDGHDLDPTWFTRAALAAAALKEGEGRPADAIRIYQRVVDAGVPAAPEARQRIEQLQKQPAGKSA